MLGRAVAQVPGIHADPSQLEAWHLDEGLQRELKNSRAAVAAARDAALQAKSELEAAVTASAARQAHSPATPDANAPASSTSASTRLEDANAAGTKVLKRLIADLRAERMELLAHLTDEHPLIRDADMRLAEYERQLVGLTVESRATAETGAARMRIVVEEQRTAETYPAPPEAPAAGAEESPRLEQALAKWESAQSELEAALDRESATADRLAALMARHAESQRTAALQAAISEPTDSPDNDVAVVQPQAPVEPAQAESQGKGSHPLVMAAFVLALVVAAVASIKLARSTDQSLFAGADDAAAALSLPVVGVIPAGSAAARIAVLERHRSLVVLIQLLAAVAVFALVAMLVQNPGAVWQFLSAPLDAWR